MSQNSQKSKRDMEAEVPSVTMKKSSSVVSRAENKNRKIDRMIRFGTKVNEKKKSIKEEE